MKIAFFSDNFYPELSGISDSLIALTRALAKRGHKIRIYAPRYAKKDFATAKAPLQELNLGKNISIIRLPSISYPSPTGQGRASICGLRGFLNILAWSPDVIHTQLFFGVGLSALIIAKLLRKPLLGTNHTATSEFARYLPWQSTFLKKLFERYVSWYYNRCAFVTGPSNSVFLDMVAAGFKAPHRALSNPVDIDAFPPATSAEEKAELKKKFNLSGMVLAYTGRLAKEKNINDIIAALPAIVKEVPHTMLALAGRGVEMEALAEQAKKLGVQNAVHFLGMLNKDDLAKLYRATDIFIIMSTSETQGLSMMQAMAAGLPVIAARARSLPEYVNAKNGILIEPGDSQSLAGAIIELLNAPEKMKALGNDGLAYVKNFSSENIAREWEKIYQSL
jgi:glycosyltransferase involved in cell wall biosynthesis